MRDIGKDIVKNVRFGKTKCDNTNADYNFSTNIGGGTVAVYKENMDTVSSVGWYKYIEYVVTDTITPRTMEYGSHNYNLRNQKYIYQYRDNGTLRKINQISNGRLAMCYFYDVNENLICANETCDCN